MRASESRVIRFGVYALDVTSGELRKGGTKIRLQEQPFQVLKALVERPGEVVTREELQERLWPDGTYVDYEDGLATAVRKVRTALGDSATNPRFVETLPRRGYRFLAPVDTPTTEGSGDGLPSRQRPAEPPSPEPPRRYVLAAAVIAALAVAVSTILYFLNDSRENLPDLSQFAETPLTNYPGIEGGPSLSPDGNQVAFAWSGESGDNTDIYIKLVDSTSDEPVRLTDDPAFDFSPAWSPDGLWIAFLRAELGSSGLEKEVAKLMVMPALGGPARTVREGAGGALNLAAEQALLSQVAWSPDGRHLAFTSFRDLSDIPGTSLAAVPVEGGEIQWLTKPAGDFGAASPAFSPDGTRIAFVLRRGWGSGHDVHVLDLNPDMSARGEPQRLTEFARSAGNPVWRPDGGALLFWGEKHSGQSGLWTTSVYGGEPRLVRSNTRLATPPTLNTLSIAADSGQLHRLAFAVATEDRDIWEVDVEGPLAGRPRAIVDTNANEAGGVVSPDGRRLAFVSDRSGDRELWIAERDGSRAAQLTKLGAERMSLPDWSLDGKSLVFQSYTESGQADIILADAETGECTRLTSDPADDMQPGWSRDGEWVHFVSRQGGRGRIWKTSPDGTTSQVIADLPGFFPRESADGSSLIYGGPDRSVMRIPLRNGEAVGAPERLPFQASFPALGMTDGGIYYLDEGRLKFYDFARQNSQDLFPLGTEFRIWSVPPDGKTLILGRTSMDSDLMLLQAP